MAKKKTTSKAKRSSKKVAAKKASKSSKKRISKKSQGVKKRKSTAQKQDDLTRIEGIGPKIAADLQKAGVDSFAKLAKSSSTKIKAILKGPGKASSDPTSWPYQASLAAAKKWQELDELQEILVGGRTGRPADSEVRPAVLVELDRLPSSTRPYPTVSFPDLEQIRMEVKRRAKELQSERKKAEKTCLVVDKMVRSKNSKFGKVTNCFVSFRRKFGRVLSPLQYVVQVEVPFKISLTRLKKMGISEIPQEHQGIRIKVTEDRNRFLNGGVASAITLGNGNVDEDQVFPPDADSYSKTIVIGGLSCSVTGSSDNIGTLGICFDHDGESVAIVNQHFAENVDEGGLQPPVNPFPNSTGQHIGPVTISMKKNFGSDSIDGPAVDAAIIKLALSEGRKLSQQLMDGAGGIMDEDVFFASSRLTPDEEFVKVFKVGAATDFTESTIEHTNFTVEVDGEKARNVIKFISGGPTIVSSGDSGSALVAKVDRGLLVVGLVFAGNEPGKIGYACHFADVINELELKLDNSVLQPKDEWEFVD